MYNALSIDLEEYFQVHALSGVINPATWASIPSLVENNTDILLELLSQRNIKSTFFCLGWIAEHHPKLIKKIHSHGHEIACHGFAHKVIYQQDKKEFHNDVMTAKNILEDIISEAVLGYRAPTYSITSETLWALEILEELGFKYDSSVFPIYHDNYGIPDSPRFPYKIPSSSLIEFPISTLRIGRVNLPIAGGGYFRLLPYIFIKLGLRILMSTNKPFVFYVHPWELNPDTPKVEDLDFRSRFRTYVGIGKAYNKFMRLLKDFDFLPVKDVLINIGLLDNHA